MEASANRNSMTIIGLGSDCLEICLRHLSVADLLNVADSNKQLKHIARHVFDKMHREKTVNFTEVTKFRYENDSDCKCYKRKNYPRLKFFKDVVFIADLKLALQFLRCFGDLVSQMQFQFSRYCEPCRLIEWQHLIIEYLNEFCTESLRFLKMDGHFEYDICHKFVRSFKKVQTLSGNIFFQTEHKIHQFFPNVFTLQMLGFCHSKQMNSHMFIYTDFIANRFAHLEHLWLHMDSQYRYNTENFAIALLLNPQIKTLSGNVWFKVLFDPDNFRFWNADQNLQRLEKLDLEVNCRDFEVEQMLNITNRKDLHFKNLKELNISFKYEHYLDNTVTFPFTCDNLESLSLVASHSKFKQFANLLNKFPTVSKFKFRCNDGVLEPPRLTMNDCSIISEAFPLLEEIFCYVPIPDDDTVRAIRMFPSLNFFKCQMLHMHRIAIDHSVRSLEGWSVSNIFLDHGDSKEVIIEGKSNKNRVCECTEHFLYELEQIFGSLVERA